jgi:hypothetical protein
VASGGICGEQKGLFLAFQSGVEGVVLPEQQQGADGDILCGVFVAPFEQPA